MAKLTLRLSYDTTAVFTRQSLDIFLLGAVCMPASILNTLICLIFLFKKNTLAGGCDTRTCVIKCKA